MSKLNPVGAHIASCDLCQRSQAHIDPIAARMAKEFTGKVQAPLVACDDCRADVHGKQFMVQDALWTKISRGKEPCILCILCAEKRLGRRFEVEDFQSVPANAPWIYAVRRYGQ